jgi:hypothetical protein
MASGNRSVVIAIDPQPKNLASSMVELIRYIRGESGLTALSRLVEEYGLDFRIRYLPREGEHIGPFVRWIGETFATEIKVDTMTALDWGRLQESEWWCDYVV